jgi:mannose-1-phosphate guanylyltransferase
VESGEYYWNSGIFIWKVSAILAEIRSLLPDLYRELMAIDGALGTPAASETLERVWRTICPVTIDVGILERAPRVWVLPLDVGWSDVGSWAALADILPADEQGNVILRAEHVGLDTTDSLIYSAGRLVATVGLHNMIVVDAGDVILVCPRDRAQEVRVLVDRLKQQHKTQYL